MASPAAPSTSWPTALNGTVRPSILARWPYHGFIRTAEWRLTSLEARKSIYAFEEMFNGNSSSGNLSMHSITIYAPPDFLAASFLVSESLISIRTTLEQLAVDCETEALRLAFLISGYRKQSLQILHSRLVCNGPSCCCCCLARAADKLSAL